MRELADRRAGVSVAVALAARRFRLAAVPFVAHCVDHAALPQRTAASDRPCPGLAGVAAGDSAGPPVTRLGTGAGEVWLWPRGRPKSIVVFGHGWSTPLPRRLRPVAGPPAGRRLDRRLPALPRRRRRFDGVGPRARSRPACKTRSRESATAPARRRVGKSFGGSAVFYYAAVAHSWGVPPPTAILSIFPALPIGALPAGSLPTAPTSSSSSATPTQPPAAPAPTRSGAGWRAHPVSRKRYVVIHSRPGFVANHDSAQRSDKLARRSSGRRSIVDRPSRCCLIGRGRSSERAVVVRR